LGNRAGRSLNRFERLDQARTHFLMRDCAQAICGSAENRIHLLLTQPNLISQTAQGQAQGTAQVRL